MVDKNETNAEEINEPLKEQIVTKNRWLNSKDSFGKMEEGVVSGSITYKKEIIKDDIDQEFDIIII